MNSHIYNTVEGGVAGIIIIIIIIIIIRVMIVLYSLSNLLTHISIHYLVVALNSPKLFDNFHNISGATPSYIPE